MLPPTTPPKLIDGQAQYSALTTPAGTVVDDLLVYRFSADHLLLVVNAGTTEKDWDWITSQSLAGQAQLKNVSSDYCQLAIQGPDALGILQALTDLPLAEIKYYHFTLARVDGIPAIVSRTGYTGEDGFEVYADSGKAEQIWNKLLRRRQLRIRHRRASLRAGSAQLRSVSRPAWHSTVMRSTSTQRCWKQISAGSASSTKATSSVARHWQSKKKLACKRDWSDLRLPNEESLRDGQEVCVNGERVGTITSGSPAPYLKKNIGMAYVPTQFANEGQEIQIDVRGKVSGSSN